MSSLIKVNEYKVVKFNDIDLIGVLGSDNKVYTSVKKICDDLGLNSNRQIQKIKDNEILSEGYHEMLLPSTGGQQLTICLDVDLLPMWLVTIKPNKVKELVKPYLVEFQKRAAKILRDAFIKKDVPTVPVSYLEALKSLVASEEEKQRLLEQNTQLNQENKKLEKKANAFDSFMATTNSLTFSEVAKSLGIGRNKLFEYCRNKGLLMANNQPYQEFMDRDYFEVKTVNIQRSDNSFNTTQTMITAKGQTYIYNLMQKDKQVKLIDEKETI